MRETRVQQERQNSKILLAQAAARKRIADSEGKERWSAARLLAWMEAELKSDISEKQWVWALALTNVVLDLRDNIYADLEFMDEDPP